MAHVMKMTRGTVGHMFKHYERAKNEKGEYIKFGNEDIDTTRSHLNYNLAPESKSQGEFIKARCKEVKCLNRKDVNVACSWIVTLPKDFVDLNEGRNPKEFFESTYQFLENRYGRENVVSSFVHMDETTPHMHFCFVPVVLDTKKNLYKVSAKEVVNRYDLQTFHNDLQGHLEQTRELRASILNNATIEGNRSIEELKRGTATQKLNKIREEVKNLEGQVLTLKEVNQVKIKKPLLGGERSVIQITYQDAINLQKTAQRVGEVEGMLQTIDKKNNELKQEAINLAREKAEISRIPIKEQLEKDKLIRENKDMRKQIDTVNCIMDKRPDLYEELQKEAQKAMTLEMQRGFEIS